jgi:ATP-dependent helicase/DNAse subunit B
LRFYFKYIAKIKEKEEVTEDIEGSVFGKLFHFVMEWLYKPYINTVLDKTHFHAIRQPQNIEKAIMQAFGEVYFKTGSPDGVLHGKSILIKEILRKYILEVLQKDEAMVPFTILALEETYKSVFNAGDKQVVIGGIVDRIDEVNGAFRIIDYKTGNIEFSCPSIERLFDRSTDTKKYSAIFQALLYSLVLKQQDEFGKQPVFPGLYGLREIFRSNFDSCISVNKVKINSIHTIEAEYEGFLTEIISEMFNTDLPFTKITDKKKCEYCSYREICHR